jgi:hypothetical protein
MSDGLVDVYARRAREDGPNFDLERLRIDLAIGTVDHEVIQESMDGHLLDDFDGDDRPDLFEDPDDGPLWFRFSDENGDLGPKHTAPDSVPPGDNGLLQTFDLDADGATELLLAIETDDGRRQWRSLQWERCE